MVLSRREASLRPARARRSRDYFGTVSIRSNLSPLYVPVSPSPVSREACLDLWRSIGPSTMVVLILRTSLSAHPLCPQYNGLFNLHVQGKMTCISPTYQTWMRRQRRMFLTDFKTIRVCLVENMKIWMVIKGLNTRYIYDKTDTRVVHRRP